MSFPTWQTALLEGAQTLGLSLSKGSLDLFCGYLKLLLPHGERLNLTAATDPLEIAVKHFLDSLTCLPALEVHQATAGRSLVDVGSGAGFPGIPLAIARPELMVTLLESAAKKCRFMQTAAHELGLKNVTVACARAEEFGRAADARESFDIAVSRAVAALPVVAEYCLPLVRVGGVFLAMKGPKAADEIEDAGSAFEALGGRFHSARGLSLPGGAGERVLILVDKISHTPARYPRRPGLPRKRPLAPG